MTAETGATGKTAGAASPINDSVLEPTDAEAVPPQKPTIEEKVKTLLVGKRLNNRDGDGAADRWARECKVARLVPTGELVESPTDFNWSSRAEPPPPTPAATETRVPMTLHGKSRRPPDRVPPPPYRN